MVKAYGLWGNVTFYGHVSEKRKFELMARAHLLLHASVKEGWGLVVSEAAAVGTPAVVYNVNGLRDVVKNGRTGVVLTENSPREMAEEAVKLVNDSTRYKLYQKRGKEWVGSLHWKDAASQSLALLLRACENRG
jgi:glycosyltransferase involved in cell wall biosynthesis